MPDDIRLEGFAEHLRGKKIYCVAATETAVQQLVRSCVSSLDTEVAHRGRKALFVQEGSTATSWLLRMKWDATFIIRDNQDIRLALTYVMNAAKPTRVVWAGGEPPAAVFQYLSKQEAISLIGFGANAREVPSGTPSFGKAWTRRILIPCSINASEFRRRRGII